jgi:hypothetical protein
LQVNQRDAARGARAGSFNGSELPVQLVGNFWQVNKNLFFFFFLLFFLFF